MDAAVNAEMRLAYNFSMAYPRGVSGPWIAVNQSQIENDRYADLLAIFRSLHAVANNKPTSIGGGGTPLRPNKIPICRHEEKKTRKMKNNNENTHEHKTLTNTDTNANTNTNTNTSRNKT